MSKTKPLIAELPEELADPDTGENSDVGRTGWDWKCAGLFLLLVLVSYGLGALIVRALMWAAGWL